MITFYRLLKEIEDTETFIVEHEYMDIEEFIELIGEWNEQNKQQIKLMPHGNSIKYELNDLDSDKEMTYAEVKKFVKHFESIMPHSWSAVEFLGYARESLF